MPSVRNRVRAVVSAAVLASLLTVVLGLIMSSLWRRGADAWFWLHAVQAVVFAFFAILAFRQLAQLRPSRATSVDGSLRPVEHPHLVSDSV